MKHKIEVKINKTIEGSSLKAIATVTIDELIVIRKIKLVEKKKSRQKANESIYFISMPNEVYTPKGKDTQYFDHVYFLDKDFLDLVTRAVADEYYENEIVTD